MDFVTWGHTPWDQVMLVHIAWDLLWASVLAGALFLIAHACYMFVWPRRKRDCAQTDRLEAAFKTLPERIPRHSLAARLFHWVMAGAMFVLLFTAFLPIAGIKFAWVTIHWIAGLVLTASIAFHIVHASFFLDFWSIWVSPRDIREARAQRMRDLGHEDVDPKPGKYPLGNRLYHLVIVFAALSLVPTGLFMMVRVQTPFFTRNPYLFSDAVWGYIYVLHGLAGIGLVGLVMAHVYFALRPEKLWITKSMLRGWITRRRYLDHHDPGKWAVEGEGAPRLTE
ncbi:MAG: cytochrome b/b6 domain-containing protein [Acidobacteria bacterium]|nr:cytochrome b/b6 domain-containing protein [Acidobacteriota bacterium]